MKAALEGIGYGPCYHMADCIGNPLDCDMWVEALKAKFLDKGRKYTRDDWDQLLGHCQSVADVPPAAFIPELHAAYPDAKVIIVQRDPNSWYTSCRGTVMQPCFSKQMKLLSFLDRFRAGRLQPMLNLIFISLFGVLDSSREAEMREAWIDGYARAYEEARSIVPEELRLEYKLGQGWEPLCKFLGTEVPDQPFPHVNDSADFAKKIPVMMKTMWISAAKANLPYLVGVLAVTGAVLWYR
ncbi:MAG: hypothetical protein LQ350_003313 [Teloschistes chrysophthalmus]|nr:MAG: hypothetical protein LQ350_003313 [Niorma chrysophthalma]